MILIFFYLKIKSKLLKIYPAGYRSPIMGCHFFDSFHACRQKPKTRRNRGPFVGKDWLIHNPLFQARTAMQGGYAFQQQASPAGLFAPTY